MKHRSNPLMIRKMRFDVVISLLTKEIINFWQSIQINNKHGGEGHGCKTRKCSVSQGNRKQFPDNLIHPSVIVNRLGYMWWWPHQEWNNRGNIIISTGSFFVQLISCLAFPDPMLVWHFSFLDWILFVPFSLLRCAISCVNDKMIEGETRGGNGRHVERKENIYII